jgi:fibronectin-binding autotransporter adhesin
MRAMKFVNAIGFSVGLLHVSMLSPATRAQDIYTWEGDVSSDMANNDNWVGSPVVDFITGDDQWVFGASMGSVAPQLGPGDGESVSWIGQTGAGVVNTAILFDAGAPAYTIGNGGDTARAVGLWTVTTGSADVVNNSGNTQTFNVLVRQRISTINAAAGDIVFNGEFRVGDAVSSTSYYASFQGDDNIYLNGTVTGYMGGTTASQQNNRSRIFYDGASTTAENAGKLILGDIGNMYRGKIIVSSQKGGAVVATHNNSFGDPTYFSGVRDTYIGNTSGGTGDLSNGVVEIDGSAGPLSIAENFRGETRTLANGAPHIRNVAGNNTLSGYVIPIIDGGVSSGADAFIIESKAGTLTITGGVGQNLANTTVNTYVQGESNGEIGFGGAGWPLGFSDDVATAIMNVVKRGTGTWTILAGTPNIHRGTTTIAEGKYVMNGTHSMDVNPYSIPHLGAIGDYAVQTGGILAGNGTIGSVGVAGSPGVPPTPINVNVQDGTLAPGASAGTLTIIGNLGFLDTSVLSYELTNNDFTVGGGVNDLISVGGNSAIDATLVGGNLMLDGTLNVTVLGGSQLTAAGSYRLFNYAGALTDNGLNLGSIALGAGLSASINTSVLGQVNLLVTSSGGLPGDYNGDGKVDGADYVMWRKGLSPDSSPAGYKLWRDNFGNPPGSGSGLGGSGNVPEPTGAAFALFAILMGCSFPHRLRGDCSNAFSL